MANSASQSYKKEKGDWECKIPTCGNKVFGYRKNCNRCGSTKKESLEAAKGTYPDGDWQCICGATNRAHRRRCVNKKCGWCPRCSDKSNATCDEENCDNNCKECNRCVNEACAETKTPQDAVKKLKEVKLVKEEKVRKAHEAKSFVSKLVARLSALASHPTSQLALNAGINQPDNLERLTLQARLEEEAVLLELLKTANGSIVAQELLLGEVQPRTVSALTKVLLPRLTTLARQQPAAQFLLRLMELHLPSSFNRLLLELFSETALISLVHDPTGSEMSDIYRSIS